jgi:precorrin-8X/cobalt-precorrin-8 methylmutase
MSIVGLIILCHGSRGQKAADDLPATMQGIVTGVTALLPRSVTVSWAALQFNKPTLEEAVASIVANGATSILIIPYFLFSGRHIEKDIPEIIQTLSDCYPGITFAMARTLGDSEQFIPQLVDRIREVTPELWLEIPSSHPPEAIENQSMEIIDSLLPSNLSLTDEDRSVVKRIIHACGDPQIINLLRFSPEAIASGIKAIKNGSPIFTDVHMVAVGINSRAARACRCSVTCALDELAKQVKGETRTATAIKSLGQKLNGAIIAIGNAPTALLALLDLVKNHKVRPGLVIGMPVGFVQAAESKELLSISTVPFITIAGTRGGSAMAAAAVNALLKLAAGKDSNGMPG